MLQITAPSVPSGSHGCEAHPPFCSKHQAALICASEGSNAGKLYESIWLEGQTEMQLRNTNPAEDIHLKIKEAENEILKVTSFR